MPLTFWSEEQELVWFSWIVWRLEAFDKVWMGSVIWVPIVAGSIMIDFVHVVNENLILAGVEVLLQLFVLVQQLLLVLLLVKLVQYVLDVEDFSTLIQFDVVHAIIEIVLHVFGVGQVLHDAQSTFQRAQEAAPVAWVVVEMLIPIIAHVVHIEHSLYLSYATKSSCAYCTAQLIALGVVAIDLLQIWGQVPWCIFERLWIASHADSSILVASLWLEVGTISVFTTRSYLVFVGRHPIELGFLILLLLLASFVECILACAVDIEQIDPHLSICTSLLALWICPLILCLPLLAGVTGCWSRWVPDSLEIDLIRQRVRLLLCDVAVVEAVFELQFLGHEALLVCALTLWKWWIALTVVSSLLLAGIEVEQAAHHEFVICVLAQLRLVFDIRIVVILADLQIPWQLFDVHLIHLSCDHIISLIWGGSSNYPFLSALGAVSVVLRALTYLVFLLLIHVRGCDVLWDWPMLVIYLLATRNCICFISVSVTLVLTSILRVYRKPFLIQLYFFVLILCYLLHILHCWCLVVGVAALNLWLRYRGWCHRRNSTCTIRPSVARFSFILIWLLELLLLGDRGHVCLLQMLIRECELARSDVAIAAIGGPIALLLCVDHLIRHHRFLLLHLAVAVVDLLRKSLLLDIFAITLPTAQVLSICCF